jgi:predicted DNA-binding transcriptional regulator AlpA
VKGAPELSPAVLERLLRPEEVVEWLGLKSVSQLYELVRPRAARVLPHVKLGKYLRFERHAVQRFIEQCRDGGATR